MGVENYHVGELVGEGSYGKVHKGRRKFTGQTVAMKFILKLGKYKEEIQDLRKEIKILRTLKHENIIQMLDSFESPEYICVVTEFAQGELFKIHEDDKCLPEEEVQKIAKQLVRALDYLHSSGIVHRDMKPQNILICAGSVVKLCDFGFARAMSANTVVLQSIKGTPLYMAPEIVQQKKYNHTADLWSTGVILYELFVGQPPFNTESFGALFEKIKKDRVKYPDSMSSNFRSFLTGLLIKDRHSRLTWPKLLNHPFVAETFEDVEARELRANTAASRGCDAAWKGEHHVQTTTLAYAPEGSGFLLNVGSSGGKVSADDKDMVRAIKEHIKKYRQKVELKDAAVEVILLGKDLLNPNIMRRLLDNSSPREVILDVLSIVSDLAFMDKNIYEHIKGADILELLKRFLTHEHPNVRAKACNAIANMCRHSSYFYRLLAKHNIITLLVDRCSDEDKRTRNFSCYAIGNAAYHNDFLYEELRRCIPQLAKLLLSAEEDITKANASGALRNLVRNSNKLCDDIVSTGAMEALMKLVADYSAVALNPSRRDAINESPLERALYSLSKMCDHSPCRQFLRLSDLYPVIGRLRESKEANIATNATNIYNKTRDA